MIGEQAHHRVRLFQIDTRFNPGFGTQSGKRDLNVDKSIPDRQQEAWGAVAERAFENLFVNAVLHEERIARRVTVPHSPPFGIDRRSGGDQRAYGNRVIFRAGALDSHGRWSRWSAGPTGLADL